MPETGSTSGSVSVELVRPVQLGTPDDFLEWVKKKGAAIPSFADIQASLPEPLKAPIGQLLKMRITLDALQVKTGPEGRWLLATSAALESPQTVAGVVKLEKIGFRVTRRPVDVSARPPSAPSKLTTEAELVLHANVAGQALDLAALIDPAGWAFEGTLRCDQKHPLDLTKFLGTLFPEGQCPPPAMLPSTTVRDLSARYASNTFALDGSLVVDRAHTVQLLFAALRQGSVVALKFDSEVGLDIDILRGIVGDISLGHLRVAFATAAIDDVPERDAVILPIEVASSGKRSLPRGISLAVKFGEKARGQDLVFAQPAATPAASASKETSTAGSTGTLQAAPPAPESDDGTGTFRKWFPIDKTFGPLKVRRVGGEWNGKEGRVGFLLDSALDLSALKIGLTGLKVSLPVKSPSVSAVGFELDGLDLAFKSGPVEISGGLLRVKDAAQVEYTGTALIKTEAFSVSAFGAYTMTNAGPSLFVYALLDKDLGGPPCFHVTGLAAGFGYNRALKLPDVEKVGDFPLVKAAMEPAKYRDLGAIATDIREFMPAAAGEYWLAVGVRFTSFQLLESFALLAVSFGTEVVIAGLGLSRLTVPPALPGATTGTGAPSETLALVEVALKVVFRPESGVLSAEARITPNSYVFSKDGKLTGGFAFYAWFKDVTRPGKPTIAAGDFVVTLGGYHPRFVPPDHYPVVPRLGLNWQVTPKLRVAGEVYFALTPTCVMAGGRLSALFADGPLRAWFDAYADFLISWKPVHYEIDIGIRIGISFDLSLVGISCPITVEMSAAVQLWGPPFAGKARIDWTVISFTVYFGAALEKPETPRLTWGEFADSFLPRGHEPSHEGADPLTIAVTRGVISEVKPAPSGTSGYVIVNAHQATIVVKSVVPSLTMRLNDDGALPAGPAFGIRPMGVDAGTFSSDTHVTVMRGRTSVSFAAKPITQNVPSALWSPAPSELRADEPPKLVPNALTGVELTVPAPASEDAYEVRNVDDLYERFRGSLTWKYDYALAGQRYDPSHVVDHITSSRTDGGESIGPTRRRILAALAARSLAMAPGDDLDDAYRAMQFQRPPVECALGFLPVTS